MKLQPRVRIAVPASPVYLTSGTIPVPSLDVGHSAILKEEEVNVHLEAMVCETEVWHRTYKLDISS